MTSKLVVVQKILLDLISNIRSACRSEKQMECDIDKVKYNNLFVISNRTIRIETLKKSLKICSQFF